MKSHINELIATDEDGEIEITDHGWFSGFNKVHFHYHISKMLKEMTTYTNGESQYARYRNGYWYNDIPGDEFTLKHDGSGRITIEEEIDSDHEDF